MKRRTWLILAVLLVVIVVGWIVIARRNGNATTVDVGRVTKREVFRSYVTASGEIVATRFADIGSSVMGKIVALNVAEGDRVRTGQILARIDPVQARSDSVAAGEQVKALESEEEAARRQAQSATASVAQAEARAREASQTLARAIKLRADGLTPLADLDTAQAGSDAAAALVAAAKADLDRALQMLTAAGRRVAQARAGVTRTGDILSKTEIVAPIDGIVSRLQVRLGEMVVIGIQNQPGTTLMTVSDLSSINAEIKVAEADFLRVALGQAARVTLEAVPGREFTGRVVEVGASALPIVGSGAAVREFKVVVRLDQPDPGLRPGLTCDAEVLTAERQRVLTVPLQAVVLRSGPDGKDRTGVFQPKDGKAAFLPVKAGIIGGLDMEIEGVSEGTPIIVGPFQVLRDLTDGAPIRTASAGQTR
jgi:HlyD family secretion protein